MKIAENWIDYKVIATGTGEKLEKWGKYILLRPDPQVIWKNKKNLKTLEKLSAHFVRTENKSGEWKYYEKLPESWTISWKELKFKVQPMNFKHTGIFPEQAVNWEILENIIKTQNRKVKVLNLFAYTGAMSIVCAKAGAEVTHVDSAKNMVARAKENAKLSNLEDKPIRYIIDDCIKFVEKEIRRGNTYDIILMDPPSFGRGPNNEMWKLEDNIFDFVNLCTKLLSEKPLLMLINSYTTGLQPTVMANILNKCCENYDANVQADEIGLPTDEKNIILPCGCSAYAYFGGKNGI